MVHNAVLSPRPPCLGLDFGVILLGILKEMITILVVESERKGNLPRTFVSMRQV